MIPVPDEMLMAYVDGELTPEEAQALEQLVRQDPALRARLEPFIQTRTRLASAFDQTLSEPVPYRLVAAIRHAPVRGRPAPPSLGERIRDMLAAASAAVAPNGFNPAMAASMAALVLVGATAGWLAGRKAPSGWSEASAPPALVATGALAHVLETNPSGVTSTATANGTSVTPVLSFRTASDSVCREYRVQGVDAKRDFAGLACRSKDGTWRVAMHVETPKQPPAASGPYATATGGSVPAINAHVERIIAGETFDRKDETSLLKHGWDLSEVPSIPAPKPN